MLLSNQKRFEELCDMLLLFQEKKVKITTLTPNEVAIMDKTSDQNTLKKIVEIFTFWLGRVPIVKRNDNVILVKY